MWLLCKTREGGYYRGITKKKNLTPEDHTRYQECGTEYAKSVHRLPRSAAMVFCCMSASPPREVKAKGGRGAAQRAALQMQNNPHIFALGLKDACCAEPLCCIAASMGAPMGCTACWARKAVLEKCTCRSSFARTARACAQPSELPHHSAH